MPQVTLLKNNWHHTLATLLSSAQHEIIISSPFVTPDGTNFVLENTSPDFREGGELTFITNLSPTNQIQGITNPNALRNLTDTLRRVGVFHLPRLHAKAYIFDRDKAVITSGNLTSGGLRHNHEYGVLIDDNIVASNARQDILDYAYLGTLVTKEQLSLYCDAVEEATRAFQKQQVSVSQTARQNFENALRAANDELIKLRLAEGAMHTVFERTVLFLLRQHGALDTHQVYLMVQQIHPDLCDDSVDRVINGRHFGKKWKHAVRTSQQQLKRKGLVDLIEGKWQTLDAD